MLRFVCGFVSIVVVIQGPHRPITWLTFQTDTACSDTRQEMPTATESHSIKQRIPANCVVYNCNSYVLYMYVSVCVCFIVSYILYIYIYGHTCLYYIYRRYTVHLWGAKVSAFSASSWTGESESSAARTAPQVTWRSSAAQASKTGARCKQGRFWREKSWKIMEHLQVHPDS